MRISDWSSDVCSSDLSGEGFVKPMLATLTSGPFSRNDWLFENKWDGYRVVARLAGDKVWLYSRSGKSFNSDYVPVAEALNGTGHDLVLDGEIVVMNGKDRKSVEEGKSVAGGVD